MSVRDQPITFTDLLAHQLQTMHAAQNGQLDIAYYTPAAHGLIGGSAFSDCLAQDCQ